MSPTRIQLSRKRGGKLPPNTINVARPSRWGNPFPVGKEGPLGRVAPDNAGAVGMFEDMLRDPEMRAAAGYPADLSPLAGKNLACWCRSTDACHADVLLRIANPTVCEAA
jgi:hypothetical protein